MRLFVVILVACCGIAQGSVSVSDVLRAYNEALAAAGSISADIESWETFDERPRSMYLRGLLTIQGGANPKFRFTGARQYLPRSSKLVEGTAIQAVFDSEVVSLACWSDEAVYHSPIASLGGHLLGAKLDPDFMLLLYPELIGDLSNSPRAQVKQKRIGNRLCDVLSVDGTNGTFTIYFDAKTHLPTYIERIETTWRGTRQSTLTLENIRISSKQPPNELFELLVPSGFATSAYRPGSVHEGDEAPSRLIELHSGTFFDLKEARGTPLILFFSADWSETCRNMMPAIKRLAESAASVGVHFIELDIWPSRPVVKTNDHPWRRGGGDSVADAYGVQTLGVPTIFFIDSSGTVQEILTGYNPRLTESAIEEAFSKLASTRPEEPEVDSVDK